MHIPRAAPDSQNTIVYAVLASFVVLAIGLFILCRWLRVLRISNAEPRYIPTKYLKNKWRAWSPSSAYYNFTASHRDLNTHASAEVETSTHAASSGFPSHRQSVRSILTLPPYQSTPSADERLIAREGERAGVDLVVQFPDTEGDIEARREEEMSALYNIRQTRRREQEERQERRRERQEARERGDWALVERLERESRARAAVRATSETDGNGREGVAPDSSTLVTELYALRQNNARSRRVSSVSYADLGLARHDGSRISLESDHSPLVDSAASMGRHGGRSRAVSLAESQTRERSRSHASRHGRQASVGSQVSAVTFATGLTQLTPSTSRDGDVPPNPPSYDDDISVHGGEVPPYEDPVDGTAPELPDANASSLAAGERVPGRGPLPAPLLLVTGSTRPPPAIAVHSATPVTEVPTMRF